MKEDLVEGLRSADHHPVVPEEQTAKRRDKRDNSRVDGTERHRRGVWCGRRRNRNRHLICSVRGFRALLD
jgi:hypothetical protein